MLIVLIGSICVGGESSTMKKSLTRSAFTLFFCLLVSSFSHAAQKSIEGHWEGTMTREGATLAVSFDFTSEAAEIKASFNSPTQRAMGIPLRNVGFAAPKIHFEPVGDV